MSGRGQVPCATLCAVFVSLTWGLGDTWDTWVGIPASLSLEKPSWITESNPPKCHIHASRDGESTSSLGSPLLYLIMKKMNFFP